MSFCIEIKHEGKIFKGDIPRNPEAETPEEEFTLEEFLEILQKNYPNFDVVRVIDTELNRDVWPDLKANTKLPVKAKSILVTNQTEFKFKLGGGKLVYNLKSERLEVLEEDGNRISLHCGDLIDIYLNGKWETHRIEMFDSWYIVDLFDEYQIPKNLLVKYHGRGTLSFD